jgi:hypothetical protein
METMAYVLFAAVFGFFGTICYGLTILSRAISGKFYRSRELEALRSELQQLRQEYANTLCTQDDHIQRLSERLRSVEQALPPLRAGAAVEDATARLRQQG